MKLAELEAQLLRRVDASTYSTAPIPLADADGVMFLCPGCWRKNDGPVGTHSIICWFSGRVPDDVSPGPGRWVPAGNSVDDLTFIGPAAASIQITGGCNWHGFIKNGEAIDA